MVGRQGTQTLGPSETQGNYKFRHVLITIE